MSVPTAYDETQLKAYMLDVVGGLGARLELIANDFNEAVISTLLLYGVNEAEDAKDIAKLRAIARMEAWRRAASKATGAYDFTADGSTFRRSELAKQAQQELEQAEREAMSYGALVGYRVTTARLRHTNDPYQVQSEHDG